MASIIRIHVVHDGRSSTVTTHKATPEQIARAYELLDYLSFGDRPAAGRKKT